MKVQLLCAVSRKKAKEKNNKYRKVKKKRISEH